MRRETERWVLILYDDGFPDEVLIFETLEDAKKIAEKPVPNPYFERCKKFENHPYHGRVCDKYCPDWELCNYGELTTRDYIILKAREAGVE